MGRAYLRYAHTKGTVQEVDHLVDALALAPGKRVLDVGCGPGRHAHELARRGIACHGIDISARFVELAREGRAGRAPRSSAPTLGPCAYDAEFDAVIALCQGAFGMSREPVTTRRSSPGWPVRCAPAGGWPDRLQRLLRRPLPHGRRLRRRHRRRPRGHRDPRRARRPAVDRSVDRLLHAAGAAPAGRRPRDWSWSTSAPSSPGPTATTPRPSSAPSCCSSPGGRPGLRRPARRGRAWRPRRHQGSPRAHASTSAAGEAVPPRRQASRYGCGHTTPRRTDHSLPGHGGEMPRWTWQAPAPAGAPHGARPRHRHRPAVRRRGRRPRCRGGRGSSAPRRAPRMLT